MTEGKYTGDIVHFINSIGIECREGEVSEPTFLPGISIQNGCIIYDPEQLLYPGDLLHEAGHLAVLREPDRIHADPKQMSGDLSAPAVEMGAIAWSWAALLHLGIPADILFHNHGYKGGSANLIENFSAGKYVGVPLLAWLGLTNDPSGKASVAEERKYPYMKRWLRV